MILKLTVMAESAETERELTRELAEAFGSSSEMEIRGFSEHRELGQIIFVDEALPGLSQRLEALDRKGRAIFLIMKDGNRIPAVLIDRKVDDVLVRPFRAVEALSKLSHYQQILMWDEVHRLNATFSDQIERLKEDVQLAESLQKSKLPVRFPEIKGFKVTSRYLAGMRSGGDHLDLAEARESNQLSIVLSDSSSYGLSSAVLSALMRVAVKLSSGEARSAYETVKRVQEELAATLKEKDKLSLFYGILSRKDYRLKFLNLGTSSAYHAPVGRGFKHLEAQGGALTRDGGFPQLTESEIALQPEDRLVLVSDGFLDAVGGPERMTEFLDQYRKKEAADLLNDLVFKIKSKLSAEDLPEQDCTAAVFDVDARLIKLA